MAQYLLSVHAVEGVAPDPMTPEEMQTVMERVGALEAEMKDSGTFVFSAKLTEASEATVVHTSDSGLSMTDGPFAEAKEHIGGFYIINAANPEVAQGWAKKVVECIGQPIEVRALFEMPGD